MEIKYSNNKTFKRKRYINILGLEENTDEIKRKISWNSMIGIRKICQHIARGTNLMSTVSNYVSKCIIKLKINT